MLSELALILQSGSSLDSGWIDIGRWASGYSLYAAGLESSGEIVVYLANGSAAPSSGYVTAIMSSEIGVTPASIVPDANGYALYVPPYQSKYLRLIKNSNTFTAPATPTLGQSAAGTLSAATYYVKVTYTTKAGESLPSTEASLAVSADNVLTVTAPSAYSLATGYNVYAATTSGGEVLQNSTPISLSDNWTLPVSGLISGTAAPPSTSTAINTTVMAFAHIN